MQTNVLRNFFMFLVLVTLALAVTAAGGATAEGAPQPARSDAWQPTPPLAGTRALAVGRWTACALLESGDVVCWGMNANGQVGDGTTIDRSLPVRVTGLGTGVQAIGAGGGACALTAAGGVKCWGNTSLVPQAVDGLESGVDAIAVGVSHACALVQGGSVKCWGSNEYGQLGDGTIVSKAAPVTVAGLHGVQRIAAGWYHTCAITDGGCAVCWGDNQFGQLGDGTRTARSTPVPVSSLHAGVQAVAGGYQHTCALTASGVKCWGGNAYGQLGHGDTQDHLAPVDVVGLIGGMRDVAAGYVHSCAVDAGGGVVCWGGNDLGELGIGSFAGHRVPAPVSGLARGVKRISAGFKLTCAVTVDGGAKCWGNNHYGTIGRGTTAYSQPAPAAVSSIGQPAANIAAGYRHTCAVTASGGVKCWGGNGAGQLGNGTTSEWQHPPVDVSGLGSGVRMVTVGIAHSCAAMLNGSVQCWGWNRSGQLGDGTVVLRSAPVTVVGLEQVQAVAAGDEHTCALTHGGGVLCWGANTYGQLGIGSTSEKWTPVAVPGLGAGVQAIAAGMYHTCALTSAERVKCWGASYFGQVGDGTYENQYSPVDVIGLTEGIQAISAGDDHTCALSRAGGVQCWGANRDGQLGDGTHDSRATPSPVRWLLQGVKSIAVGRAHTCAVKDDGSMACWGLNDYGQLGNDATVTSAYPVDVVGSEEAVATMALGGQHSCALTVSGSVLCWGYNNVLQLGLPPSWTPADVLSPRPTLPLYLPTVGAAVR